MSDVESPTLVEDDEFIFRRIPIRPGWYDPASGVLMRQAFNPRNDDTTGLSVTRAHSERHPDFLTPAQDAALGTNTSGYYVAVLGVGDLRKAGIEVVASPDLPQNPGHAHLPQLTYDSRRSDESIDTMERLSTSLTLRVEGPFPSSA